MRHTPIVALVIGLVASQAQFAAIAADVEPDRLAFGTTYVGSIVEGSFVLLVPAEPGPAEDTGINLEIAAPDFVRVLRQRCGVRQADAVRKKSLFAKIALSIDTKAAGDFNGEIVVALGKTTVKVPVSATVRPPKTGQVRVLFAESPYSAYSDDPLAWTLLVKNGDLNVSYLVPRERGEPPNEPVLRDLDLSRYDCLVLSDGGLVWLTAEDARRTQEFVERGGRAVVAANCFMSQTTERANELVGKFGLMFRDEEARREQQKVLPVEADVAPQVRKAGIESLYFFRASPIALSKPTGRVLVRAVGVGQEGDGFVVVAEAAKGEVVAIGISMLADWVSPEGGRGADNGKLLSWLLRVRAAE